MREDITNYVSRFTFYALFSESNDLTRYNNIDMCCPTLTHMYEKGVMMYRIRSCPELVEGSFALCMPRGTLQKIKRDV